jgi:hypothetical protein
MLRPKGKEGSLVLKFCKQNRRRRVTLKQPQLTMRTILWIWSSTVGWPPNTLLMGDIVSGARRHEMAMSMDG